MLRYFIPAVFKGRRILSEKYLGISIEHGLVRAALIKHEKTGVVIDQLIEHSFKINEQGHKGFGFGTESLVEVLKKIKNVCGSVDSVRFVLPANLSFFKNLQVPFRDEEQFDAVIGFAVEPFLPFDLDAGSVAFFKMKNVDKRDSSLFVAAMKSADLSKVVSAASTVDLEVASSLISVVAAYGLVLQVPEYQDYVHYNLFIDFDAYVTTLGFLEGKKIRLIRTSNQGLKDVLDSVAQKSGLEPSVVLEKLFSSTTFHTGDASFDQVLLQEFEALAQQISQMINAFLLTVSPGRKVGRIIIFDRYYRLEGLDLFLQDFLGMPCEPFSFVSLQRAVKVKKSSTFDDTKIRAFAFALAGALDFPEIRSFDITKGLLPLPYKNFISRQLLVALGLFFTVVFCIAFIGASKLVYFTDVYAKREKELFGKLKAVFPVGHRFGKKIYIKRTYNDAVSLVEEKKKSDFLLGYDVPDFLEVLLELTRAIDKNRYDVSVKNVVFKPNKEALSYSLVVDCEFVKNNSKSILGSYDSFVKSLLSSKRIFTIKDIVEVEEGSSTKSVKIYADVSNHETA